METWDSMGYIGFRVIYIILGYIYRGGGVNIGIREKKMETTF